MSEKVFQYTSQDLAFVIPTRNRPEKLRYLLDSIKKQTVKINQIVIVSSGNSIEKEIEDYKNILPIKNIHSEKGGQICQRNIGIKNVSESALLIASLDDDIYLYPNAVEKMIECWGTIEENTAGVSFNIVNEKAHNPPKILIKLGLTSEKPGLILKSGFITSLCNVERNINTSWLPGGATVWKREILENNHHDELSGKWAVGEDVIFSYPISKKFRLLICADAKVKHEPINDQFLSKKVHFEKGKTISLWKLHFVIINKDLSIFSYIYVTSMFAIILLLRSLFKNEKKGQELSIGMLIGLFIGLYRYLLKKKIV